MSMFVYRKRAEEPSREGIVNALGGNLCRCTGYRPIIDAAFEMFSATGDDPFSRREQETVAALKSLNGAVDTITLSGNGKRYFAPHSSDELARLYRSHPDARLLAGGTDLCLEINQSLDDLDIIIDVCRARELQAIEDAGDRLVIGAGVSLSDCAELLTGLYPDMRELLERFGSMQVRNAATIGGNIANASPVADMTVALIAAAASLVLRCGDERRCIDLEDYFLGYKATARKTSEFIEHIIVPKPRPGFQFRYYKISKRRDDDISSVCAAFSLHIGAAGVVAARVAFGGMCEIPARARHCEQALLGCVWSEAAIERARRALAQDFTPISDLRASAEYRLGVASNLLTRLYIDIAGLQGEVRVSGHAPSWRAASTPPAGSEDGPGRTVGERLPHDSAEKHVSGKAAYIDDQPASAGMLYACIGLSDHAHARIISLDLEAVRQAHGVVEVLTADDIPGMNEIGPVFPGDPVLAVGKAQFWGQPLFAVAASSQRLARKAARLAKVQYEPLEPCLAVGDALQQKNLVRPSLEFRRGDPAAAISGRRTACRARCAPVPRSIFIWKARFRWRSRWKTGA
jgi:xanthine dehydrogenase small subunit